MQAKHLHFFCDCVKLAKWNSHQSFFLVANFGERFGRHKNKEVKKAVKVLDEMSMSKEERERYEAIQKYEFNYNTGVRNAREIGIQEGEKRKQVEIIIEKKHAKKWILEKLIFSIWKNYENFLLC